MRTAAWLGRGTIFLLIPKKKIAWRTALGLIVITLVATVKVFSSSVDASTFVVRPRAIG